jgi:class 3 adenylate cyclase
MAACARCGERNPEAARFCAACGSALPPPPAVPLETRKTVTVLFCDVTGSTSLGERQDPEQVRRVLSRYYEVSRDVLQRHGGTVEKFMGEAPRCRRRYKVRRLYWGLAQASTPPGRRR